MSFVVILTSGFLFLLLIISLGFQPKLLTRINGALFLFVGLSAVSFYGTGYFAICDSIPQAVMRTLFATFCTFLGRNEISAVSSVPALSNPLMQFFMYLVHLVGLYVTASAVITSMGTRLVRQLNLLLVRRGTLSLIYGANEESLAFAQQLADGGKHTGVIVFVDPKAGGDLDSRILRMGSILFSDDSAKSPSAKFLRTIGMAPGKRTLNVYCLDAAAADNLQFANTLEKALEEAGIAPAQTRLTALLEDASLGAGLQASQPGSENGHYGYGSVLALDRADLAARMMIRTWPPYETMRFDGRGKAEENFEAVIIGFGQIGQAVLRSLVMNGQFDGSRFHAIVIAKDSSSQNGSFAYSSPELCSRYHIEFRDEDARSKAIFDELSEKRSELNYVAVCTGDEKYNAEIAAEYTAFLHAAGSRATVVTCAKSGVGRLDPATGLTETVSLYAPELLCSSKIDEMAMLLNHQYHLSEGKTAQEDWADCDYFSRLSCRASADFIDAFLASTGSVREDVPKGTWPADAKVLETLARTEHLRWIAFHSCMGYRPMPGDVFEERVRTLREQQAAGVTPQIRLNKDTQRKYHICMIPWEELDALSEKLTAITGKPVDYKEMDRDNVRLIPELLKSVENTEGSSK